MTKLEAIREAIAEQEKRRRVFSKDGNGLIPQDGWEEDFQRADEIIKGLDEICQALQAECVRKSIAEWQKDLIENPEAAMMSAMNDLESR